MNRERISPTPFSWKRLGWFVLEIGLFIVVIAVVYGFQFVLAGLLRIPLSGLGVDENGMGMDSSFMLISESVLAVGSVIGLLAVHKLGHKVFPHTVPPIGLSLRGHVREAGAGAGVAAGLYAAGFLLMLLTGGITITGVHVHGAALLQTWVFFFFVAVFEETMCRGFLLGRMMDAGVSKFVALILSSAVFAILHLANPNLAALPFVNLLLAGVLLGSAYIYTRNLWFAILLHWFWNWLQGPVLGYQVSGTESSVTHSVFDIRFSEPDLVNGGDFGFEGSVLCTCLLIVSIVLVRIYGPRFLRQAPPLSAR